MDKNFELYQFSKILITLCTTGGNFASLLKCFYKNFLDIKFFVKILRQDDLKVTSLRSYNFIKIFENWHNSKFLSIVLRIIIYPRCLIIFFAICLILSALIETIHCLSHMHTKSSYGIATITIPNAKCKVCTRVHRLYRIEKIFRSFPNVGDGGGEGRRRRPFFSASPVFQLNIKMRHNSRRIVFITVSPYVISYLPSSYFPIVFSTRRSGLICKQSR